MNKAIDSGVIGAALDEIEHELMMMGFSDDETAADDWSFSGPRIRRAVDSIRNHIEQAPEIKMEVPAAGKLCADFSGQILAGEGKNQGSFRQGMEPPASYAAAKPYTTKQDKENNGR